MVKFPFEKIKQSKAELEREFRERMSGYIIAALSLVAGLAWNDAVKTAIETLFPSSNNNTIQAKFLYAITVTIGIVLLTIVIVRWSAPNKKDKE